MLRHSVLEWYDIVWHIIVKLYPALQGQSLAGSAARRAASSTDASQDNRPPNRLLHPLSRVSRFRPRPFLGTKILHVDGFDSVRILLSRGDPPQHTGDSPANSTQRISVWKMPVWRKGPLVNRVRVGPGCVYEQQEGLQQRLWKFTSTSTFSLSLYIYIYTHIYMSTYTYMYVM